MGIIDGKMVASQIKENITTEVQSLKKKTGKTPGLAVVLVGDDPASAVYVRNKNKTCNNIGFQSFENILPANISESELLNLIHKLNNDEKVNGILVQLPLPNHIASKKILEAINPQKDVDGFHLENVGRLVTGHSLFKPCTPAGIIKLLDKYDVEIDGKKISSKLREDIISEVKELKKKTGKTPGLAVVLVGNDPASALYVRNKNKTCRNVGFQSFEKILPENTSEESLLNLIDELNNDAKVSGILVQLPLPNHIASKKIIDAINPQKDVDGFHLENVGRLVTGDSLFKPCTPAGIIKLLDKYDVEIEGKNAVIIGRSNIVGKPVAFLLLERNATVTICHSRTKNLSNLARSSDILIAAIGKPNFVTADMVKDNSVVIDVGINRLAGKLVGDVDFSAVLKKASLITPVPGGVGPMTIAMLMENTFRAFKNSL